VALFSGTKLGPYEIQSPLGAGGMGEVYRARDTRLERTVAIKVLPARFADRPELRQRLEREARTISQLSNSYICTLFDVGRQDETDYLVMEYVEGETLERRLEKGPLPPEQVFRFGVQIAEALGAAHRKGIVHRDLKPSNIMLTTAGVKLLDFGLAKFAAQPAPVSVVLSEMATAAKSITEDGIILGTFQYMAPEQLEGHEADARTDIFALGVVLYEMATGKSAFSGRTRASLIASILSSEPQPITALQPLTPPGLESLLKTCLKKDPEERWQNAHDLQLRLKEIAEQRPSTPVPGQHFSRLWLWKATVGALTLALLALGTHDLFRAPRKLPKASFSISAPDKSTFSSIGRDAGPAAVSPDGSKIAFAAVVADGRKLLFVRELDSLTAQPLSGSEGASYPFWSPDSHSLGFFADGRLKRVEATGGPVQVLCDAPLGRGGAWSRDGAIVFAPDAYVGLYQVSASGGEITQATNFQVPTDYSHRWPQFLPDGDHFLYLAFSTVLNPERGYPIYLGSLRSHDRKYLLRSSSEAMYASGYLLFTKERTLMAVAFDADKMRISGEPFPIAEQVHSYPNTASAVYSVSDSGTLAYQAGSSPAISELVWFDQIGKRLVSLGKAGDYEDPRISPDGRRIAVDRFDPLSGAVNIWVYSVDQKNAARFTFSSSFDHNPVWAPDGNRIAFDTNRNGPADIYIKPVSGMGNEEPLLQSGYPKSPTDWSPDGRFLLFQQLDPQTKYDVWVLPLEGERKPAPLVHGNRNDMDGQFSPDGRWVAYSSDESGRWEVYVTAFAGSGGKWQVSTSGGTQPRWKRDGKQLFFLAPDRKLMAADVELGSGFQAAPPRPLFETRSRYTGTAYDVAPDGKIFLVNTILSGDTSAPLTVVLNWMPGRD
jgi:serine/threonine protein kinase/tricorn protease-like protein